MLNSDRDSIVRASCAQALGKYGGLEAAPALIDALTDYDKDVALYARQSLNRISGEDHGFSQVAWMDWLESNNK
jgi:HEAT repeat protein